MNLAAAVQATLTAVCPIDGISLGTIDDKSTWRVHFAPHASEAQQAAAHKAIAAFDTLIVHRRALFARLDADAAAARAKVSTPGKDAIYAEKFAQAQELDARGEQASNALLPSELAASFPLIAASIGIDGPDAYAVAQVFLNKGAEVLQAVAAIERVCLLGKKEIAAAKDPQTAYEAIKWPT